MVKKTYTIILILLVSSLVSCAWENLPEGEQEDQFIIEVTMRLGGAIRTDLFYYIVFNVSGDPAKLPTTIFEGEDRGKYWNIYYMYGTPPDRPTGLYRGRGGIGTNGSMLIDERPTEEAFLNEVKPGTSIEGDHMTLRLDITDLPIANDLINMNMIVCNQAIDEESQFEYEYDPYVFDAFYGNGIAMNVGSNADFWNEPNNPLEDLPNEHEDVAPPEADIIGWRFEIISQ